MISYDAPGLSEGVLNQLEFALVDNSPKALLAALTHIIEIFAWYGRFSARQI